MKRTGSGINIFFVSFILAFLFFFQASASDQISAISSILSFLPFPAHSAIMHLNFDTTPSKPGKIVVQDESGNKNDAGLANGAEISNRTMGMVTIAH